MIWHEFKEYTDENRVLPAERRSVVVRLRPDEYGRAAYAIGYLRYSAGELNLPFFVVPGIGRTVTHWCDCLGDDWKTVEATEIGEHGRRARVRLPLTVAAR